MHNFNLAMLSRQGWRLLQNPDSLCGRILKARYFPNCELLEAVPRDGISYTWRSILTGLELIKKGYIWRIGDGTNVNIWSDPWIPRTWSRQIITPRGHSLLTSVNELINPLMGVWDKDLVKETFWPDDASHILKIPLREGVDDFRA